MLLILRRGLPRRASQPSTWAFTSSTVKLEVRERRSDRRFDSRFDQHSDRRSDCLAPQDLGRSPVLALHHAGARAVTSTLHHAGAVTAAPTAHVITGAVAAAPAAHVITGTVTLARRLTLAALREGRAVRRSCARSRSNAWSLSAAPAAHVIAGAVTAHHPARAVTGTALRERAVAVSADFRPPAPAQVRCRSMSLSASCLSFVCRFLCCSNSNSLRKPARYQPIIPRPGP